MPGFATVYAEPVFSLRSAHIQWVCARPDTIGYASVPTGPQQESYSDRMMVKQEQTQRADVIEDVLGQIGVMREEMLILERKLERIKSDYSQEKIPKFLVTFHILPPQPVGNGSRKLTKRRRNGGSSPRNLSPA
jgi:hypothetical protein